MNDLEKRFIENANKYKCLTFHNGFPDFLVVPEYDTRVGFFVEVKPKENPRLSPEQLKTFSARPETALYLTQRNQLPLFFLPSHFLKYSLWSRSAISCALRATGSGANRGSIKRRATKLTSSISTLSWMT